MNANPHRLDDLAHGAMLVAAVVIAAAATLEQAPLAGRTLPAVNDDTLAAAVLIYSLPALPRSARS